MRIAAVGAGRMGRGIALAFAYAGHDVALVDLKVRNNWNELRAEAMAEMQASLAMLAELGAMPADAVARVMARIKPYAHGEASVLRDAEIVFEAVPETLEAKRDAFARICELAAPEAVLASTTSTILVTDLVPLVTRPERLLNAHWLNPAYLIPLVELSVHPGTSKAVVEKVRHLLEDAGKVPVVCGPTPGYIVPRCDRGDRVHRLWRQRHPVPRQPLPRRHRQPGTLHSAAKRAKIDARGASWPEERSGFL